MRTKALELWPSWESLDMSEKHEYDNDEERDTEASHGGMAPLVAMRPAPQNIQECQGQNNDQDCSKHWSLPYVNSATACFLWPVSTQSRACIGSPCSMERLVQVETDGNAIAGMTAVVQIISVSVVIHIHVIVVVPIV